MPLIVCFDSFSKTLTQWFTRGLMAVALLFSLTGCGDEFSAKLIQVTSLTSEWAENPVGLEVTSPRLGWKLQSAENGTYQQAYQLIVASSEDKVAQGEGDIWDSGKVQEDQSQLVSYAGPALESGHRYYWRVKVWDQEDIASDWSETAYWELAPEEDFLDAQWIGAITKADSQLPDGRKYHQPDMRKEENKEKWAQVDPLAKQSIQLRKAFDAEKTIQEATVYISGLGHYELSLNGKKVGDSEFAPLWTDYDKTVYYNTYEVTDQIHQGENAIGVLLGNGMYNVTGDRYIKFLVSFGPPTLFFKMKLEYEDGSEETLSSDESWKWTASPITFNCIFGGEDYDANLEQEGWNEAGFEDNTWKQVVVQEAPSGKLRSQQATPVKIQKQYGIQEAKEPEPDVFVLDMGQNLSGFPSIKVKGEKGQKVKLTVGEHLKDNGLVGQGRTGGPHYYEYTLKGEGEESWQPRFSYYGYQYIQVEKVNLPGEKENPEWPTLVDIQSNFLYNSLAESGHFESSNEIFNQAHILIKNAVKSNMHSVFTDCPHREKLGWLEETHLNGPGLFFNYDLTRFVPKIMQDMKDAQWDNGLVPNIAPEYVVFGGDFTDSPEWGVAAIILPWMYYDYYGDNSLIFDYYPTMKRYADYLTSTAEDHIVSHGLGDWYDYGEHAAGYSKNSPIALSATSHYYFGVKKLAEAAKMVGNAADEEKYTALAEAIRVAFNEKFFDLETRQYGTGSQFSNAIPVFLDMVEPEHRAAVLDNLVADIEQRGNRLTTGDVGNRYLYQTLAENGLNEVMYKMHNHYDTPGYGFQIQFGLTTLTEQWDPRKGNSWNHFMMGQIDEWFFESLAGIQVDKENPGFKHFFLKPQVVGDMTSAKGSHESVYGQIMSSWEKSEDQLKFDFTVPVNTEATVVLPTDKTVDISVNGKAIDNSTEVLSFIEDEAHPSFRLGSGEYEIVVGK